MLPAFFLALRVFQISGGMAQDLALRGGTVLTITQGVIENGTVLIQRGKITAIGKDIAVPAGIPVLEVHGRFVMPGIIDSHSHIGFSGDDVNEMTDPVTPQIWMKEALNPWDDSTLKTSSRR